MSMTTDTAPVVKPQAGYYAGVTSRPVWPCLHPAAEPEANEEGTDLELSPAELLREHRGW